MSQQLIQAELQLQRARLAAEAEAAASAAHAERIRVEAEAGLQLHAEAHWSRIAPQLALPEAVAKMVGDAFRTGSPVLDGLQVAELKQGMSLDFVDPFSEQNAQYPIEVDTTPGAARHTLQSKAAGQDGPTLGELRERLKLEVAYGNAVRAESPNDEGFSASGYGVNPATGLGELRAARPTPEQRKAWAMAEVESLIPELSPEDRATVVAKLDAQFDRPTSLSTTAVVRRAVEGPEGGLVTVYEIREWLPDAPYPTGAGVEVVTLRAVHERAVERAESALRHGHAMAELEVRPMFFADQQQRPGGGGEVHIR